MAKKKKGSGIRSIVIAIVLLVFACITLAGIFIFTDSKTGRFKSFFIEIDGKMLLKDTPITLIENTEKTIKAKYLLPSKENMPFKATIVFADDMPIVAYGENSGKKYIIDKKSDFSKQFNLKIDGENITLSIAKWNMSAIISANSGEPVTLNKYHENYTKPLFTLVISTFDESISYNLPIFAEIPVASVTINNDNIVI